MSGTVRNVLAGAFTLSDSGAVTCGAPGSSSPSPELPA
jgi:hypothetical protein